MPNKILPTSVVGAASFININSVCYQKVGTTTAATNQSSYTATFTGCADCMCPDCSGDPSMLLTVTGSSGSINWCGETWSLPNDSGITKCICPVSYDQTPSAPYPYHRWEHMGSAYNRLRLLRRVNTTNSYGINQLALGVAGYGSFTNSDFMTWSMFGSFTSMNLNFLTGVGQPVIGDYQITNEFFGSVKQGAIIYAWEKGAGW